MNDLTKKMFDDFRIASRTQKSYDAFVSGATDLIKWYGEIVRIEKTYATLPPHNLVKKNYFHKDGGDIELFIYRSDLESLPE
jgi:hypothetical protein